MKNTPPIIYFSTVPAILVLIDGEPVLRPVPGTSAQRVINTGVMLVYDGYTYYLHVFDGWMQALQLSGPWAVSYAPPPMLDSVVTAARGAAHRPAHRREPGSRRGRRRRSTRARSR